MRSWLLSSLLSLFFLVFSERIFPRLRSTFTGFGPLCVYYFCYFKLLRGQHCVPACDAPTGIDRCGYTDADGALNLARYQPDAAGSAGTAPVGPGDNFQVMAISLAAAWQLSWRAAARA